MSHKAAEQWLTEHYGKLGKKLANSLSNLTEKQRAFCESYVRCGSVHQAARESGVATREPHLLLHAPHISAYINIVAAKAEHDLGRASTKELLERIKATPVISQENPSTIFPPELLDEIKEQFADDERALMLADDDALVGNVKEAKEADFGIMQVPAVKILINQNFGPEWIIEQLVRVAERCLQIEPVYDKRGRPIGEFQFQANGALKALELLGKTMAMFTEKLDVGDLKKREPTEVEKRIAALTQAHPELAKLVNGSAVSTLPDRQH